jgi:hypothetical protein
MIKVLNELGVEVACVGNHDLGAYRRWVVACRRRASSRVPRVFVRCLEQTLALRSVLLLAPAHPVCRVRGSAACRRHVCVVWALDSTSRR